MQSYATPAQLAEWTGEDAPGNTAALLRSATIRVARAANRSPYDVPSTGDAQALRDATCAQAAAWITAGIDPAGGGVDTAPVKRSTLLGDQVELDTSGVIAAQQAMGETICTEASDILLAAGLLWQPLPRGDDTPTLPTYGLDSPTVWGYYVKVDQPYFTPLAEQPWPYL